MSYKDFILSCGFELHDDVYIYVAPVDSCAGDSENVFYIKETQDGIRMLIEGGRGEDVLFKNENELKEWFEVDGRILTPKNKKELEEWMEEEEEEPQTYVYISGIGDEDFKSKAEMLEYINDMVSVYFCGKSLKLVFDDDKEDSELDW